MKECSDQQAIESKYARTGEGEDRMQATNETPKTSVAILFVGDPGPERVAILDAIRKVGLDPQRIDPDADLAEALARSRPLAVVVGPDVENRRELVTTLRERPEVTDIPVLARVLSPSSAQIERAILDGCDDVIIDGAVNQFVAFLSQLAASDVWATVRAPQGLAVLAEADRAERVRIAHILRRNGFDVRFARDGAGIAESLAADAPRVVISSTRLAAAVQPNAVPDEVELPWVVFGEQRPNDDQLRQAGVSKVSLVKDIENAEQLTFAINDLLAPAPPEERRTPRLLYGATVRFGTADDSAIFNGYAYNINSGGMFVRTLIPLPKGSRIKVRFTPPHGHGEVEAVAQVVWVRKFADSEGAASPAGMGIQFVEWNAGDQAVYEMGYAQLRAEHDEDPMARKLTAPAAMHDAPTAPPPEWWSPRIIAEM
jgi:uncharacterized protein (TIGR02266 family)